MPKASQPFTAFTAKAASRLRELVTQVRVSEPIAGPVKVNDSRIFDTKCLWDTGATNSCITRSTAQALGLSPISKTIVQHAKGQTVSNVYLVNIYLPNNVAIQHIRVTECADNGTWGVIIGMDIITMGDFAITNVSGKTVFSFRFPSREQIDFLPSNQKKLQKNNDVPKVGRNDRCPCGSGKKYKHCHGA